MIGIIVGSTRENRVGIKIAKWVLSQTQNRQVTYRLIDLKEFNLPHYNEPSSPKGSKGVYQFESTKRWSEEVKKYDKFIFVTPEYNGFFPGVLKDAIDYLYYEWEGKPFAMVGYGGRGALYATNALSTLLKRFNMIETAYVGVHKPWDSVDKEGNVNSEFVEGSIEELFEKIEKVEV